MSEGAIERIGQEHVDTMALHLEQSGISDVALLEALELLPDLEHGSGDRSLDVRIRCHKCDEMIDDEEMMGSAFGHFYHDRCVPSLSDGTTPLAQYLTDLQIDRGEGL